MDNECVPVQHLKTGNKESEDTNEMTAVYLRDLWESSTHHLLIEPRVSLKFLNTEKGNYTNANNVLADGYLS